jgi:hypothetical protein
MPETNITGPLWGYEQRSRRLGGLWPTSVTALYTITPVASSINEGSALTVNISGLNIPNGTYYWTTNNITSADADFSAVSGSFTITSNAGSFTVTPSADVTTEGAQTFTVSIRSGSISGTVLATSGVLTINDTSITVLAGRSADFTASTTAGSMRVGAWPGEFNGLGSTSTLEFWFNAAGTVSRIMSIMSPSNGRNETMFVTLDSSMRLHVGSLITPAGDGKDAYTSMTFATNTWYHVAIVVDAGFLSIYVNGVSQSFSGTSSGWNSSPTTSVWDFGNYVGGGTNNFYGWISNVRAMKNVKLYTANFTPATSSLTNNSIGSTGAGATGTVTPANCVVLMFQGPTLTSENSGNSYTIASNGGTVTQSSSVRPFA